MQAARSIPDVDIGRLGVGNVAPISTTAAPALGQEQSSEKGSFREAGLDTIALAQQESVGHFALRIAVQRLEHDAIELFGCV